YCSANCCGISSFIFSIKSVTVCFSVLSASLIAVLISAFARSITSFSFSSVHRPLFSRCFLKRTNGSFFSHSESSSEVLYFVGSRSEEHTSELQSRFDLVCRLLLEKKKTLYVDVV